jgi:OOP family OmpA-OmpF porin
MAIHLKTKEKKMSSRYSFIGGLVIASVISLASAAEAHVTPNMIAVKDNRGQAVRTREGLCVITRWEGFDASCDAVRRVIALEDRTVYFEFNDSTLTPEARGKLDSLVTILKSDKEIQSVSIVGYADRIGSRAYNEKLSRKRAVSVKEYLASQGYLNASVTKVRWVGKSKPSADCTGKLGRQELIACLSPDRKVEVEVNYVKNTKVIRKGARPAKSAAPKAAR